MADVIISKNPFDLLGDEGGDDAPVAKGPATPAPTAKKDDSKSAAPARGGDNAKKAAAPRNEYPRRGGYGGQVARGGENQAPRGERSERGNRGDRVERGDRPFRPPRENGDSDRPPREQNGERGSYRGGPRGGARGGRGGARGREFDRRSGNPRHDGEKKDVAGKGTWGESISAETEGVPAETAEAIETAVIDGAAPAEDTAAAAGEPEAEKEPEEVLKTLEQFLAEKDAKKNAPSLELRKPNEGADDAQWKDAVVLKKDEEQFLFAGKSKKTATTAATKEKAAKVFAPIEQRFADEQRNSYDRGGRGRGGRGRGDYDRSQGERRGGRHGRGGFVNVEDTNAFPSLGK